MRCWSNENFQDAVFACIWFWLALQRLDLYRNSIIAAKVDLVAAIWTFRQNRPDSTAPSLLDRIQHWQHFCCSVALHPPRHSLCKPTSAGCLLGYRIDFKSTGRSRAPVPHSECTCAFIKCLNPKSCFCPLSGMNRWTAGIHANWAVSLFWAWPRHYCWWGMAGTDLNLPINICCVMFSSCWLDSEADASHLDIDWCRVLALSFCFSGLECMCKD